MSKVKGNTYSSAIIDETILNTKLEIERLEDRYRELIHIINVTCDAFGPFTDQDAVDVYRLELKETMIKIHRLRSLK